MPSPKPKTLKEVKEKLKNLKQKWSTEKKKMQQSSGLAGGQTWNWFW